MQRSHQQAHQHYASALDARSTTTAVIIALFVVLLPPAATNQHKMLLSEKAVTTNGNVSQVARIDDRCETACICECNWSPGMPSISRHSGSIGTKGDKCDTAAGSLPGAKGSRGRQGAPDQQAPLRGRSQPPRQRLNRRAQQQVAFSVARSNKLGPVAKDTPIMFDRVFTNAGKRFDTFASEFVAKVNGTYAFFVHVMARAEAADAYAWIMHNDRHQLPLFGDRKGGYATGSNTAVLDLVANDRVWVQLSKGSAVLNDYTSFSGYLLYEH